MFGNTPQTCEVQCPDGTTWSATVPSGRIQAVSQALADAIAHNLACDEANQRKECHDETNPCGCNTFCLDSPADYQVGTAPQEGEEKLFEIVEGDLPNGLQMSDSGQITGDATDAINSTNVSVRITDSQGHQVVVSVCLSVLGITTDTLPDGNVGGAYSTPLVAAGGRPPYTFVVESDMPTGLTLNPTTGIISGVPDTGGSYTPLFRVTDSCGANCPVQLEITIHGVTNDPQTAKYPCVGDATRNVTINIPAGSVWLPPGGDPKLANAQARNLALQRASAAMAANGCPCYLESLSTDYQHTGIVTGHMENPPPCELRLHAYSELFVQLVDVAGANPLTINMTTSPINMDSGFDGFGPGSGSNWPSLTTWALYIPDGTPAIMDNVVFMWRHLAH